MKLEIKSSALSVQSNLGRTTHGHLGLFMTNITYIIMSPVLCVRPMHPEILLIPNNATRIASYKLKRMYTNNLQVFHKVRGF